MLETKEQRYLTTEEAARATGVTRWRVWQWIKEGRLMAQRAGTLWLIPEDELRKFQQVPRKAGRPSNRMT